MQTDELASHGRADAAEQNFEWGVTTEAWCKWELFASYGSVALGCKFSVNVRAMKNGAEAPLFLF
jgi:hypothetical protein